MKKEITFSQTQLCEQKETLKKRYLWLHKQTNVSVFLFSIYNRGAFTLKPAMKFTRSVEINLPPGFIQMLTKAVSQIQ